MSSQDSKAQLRKQAVAKIAKMAPEQRRKVLQGVAAKKGLMLPEAKTKA